MVVGAGVGEDGLQAGPVEEQEGEADAGEERCAGAVAQQQVDDAEGLHREDGIEAEGAGDDAGIEIEEVELLGEDGREEKERPEVEAGLLEQLGESPVEGDAEEGDRRLPSTTARLLWLC